MERKISFELKYGRRKDKCAVRIIGHNKFNPVPFIKIYTPLADPITLSGKDLKLFATNILKAFKDKR